MENYYKIYDANGKFKRNEPASKIKLGVLDENTDYQGGVSCIIIQNGQILLEKRGAKQVGAGTFDFCSGHIDNEEKEKETVVRELGEELGIPSEIAKKVKMLKAYSTTLNRQAQRNWHMTFFYLEIPNNFKLAIQEDEVENIVFVPIKDAIELIKEGNRFQFPYDKNMETMLIDLERLTEQEKEER